MSRYKRGMYQRDYYILTNQQMQDIGFDSYWTEKFDGVLMHNDVMIFLISELNDEHYFLLEMIQIAIKNKLYI